MILVILPLGKEAKDVWDWVFRTIMYTAGTTVGAMLLALLLGLVGQGLHALFPGIPYQWPMAVLGVASVVFALKELNIIHVWTPQLAWQVPKVWQKDSRLFGQTAYGLFLGAGIFTYIPFASFFIVLAWELVAGAYDLRVAVMIGFAYGLVRGIPAILGGISMLRGQYPLPVSNWLIEHLGWWHALNGLALVFVGSFLVSSFLL
jgi:hypothetical protein